MFARLFLSRRSSAPRTSLNLEILENRLAPATTSANPLLTFEQQVIAPFVQAANTITADFVQLEKNLAAAFQPSGSTSAQVQALNQLFLLAAQGGASPPAMR
jgi:hypothetical protein